MKFTIDAKAPLDREHPCRRKCVQILNELPDGSLVTKDTLANLAGYAIDTIKSHLPLLAQEYWTWGKGHQKLYGNQKTIAAWRKEAAAVHG